MRRIRSRVMLGILMIAAAGGAAAVARPGEQPPAPVSEPAPLLIPAATAFPAESTPRPDPCVSLDWSGPSTVKRNRPAEYTLTVRNRSSQPAQQIVVQVRAPKGVTVGQTVPAAKVVDGVYLWEVGTLDPRVASHLKLTLTTTSREEIGCQAWVTFTGTSGMRAVVKEPKLDVAISAPESVVLGDTVKVTYTVKNVGDAPAESVRHLFAEACCDLGCPVTTALVKKKCCMEDGTDTLAIKVLNPGESKTEAVTFQAKRGGEIPLSVTATADDATSVAANAKIRVLVPKLTTTVTGPETVMIGRKSTYRVTVKNTGDIPVTVQSMRRTLPAGWQPVVGTMWDALTTPEVAPIIAPSHSTEYTFDVIPTTTGSGTVFVEARGSRETASAAECRTAVEGIPALRMELIDVVDPVEKGQGTTYEIRVTNTGSKADGNVTLTCPLPEQLKFVSATGPVSYKVQELGSCTMVKFEPVRELAPKTNVVFRITVTAATAGDVRFKAQMTSDHLTTSVVKEESTRVYGE